MAVKIRLARAGGKKAPFYRVVAADSRAPRDGRFIEILGRYNPRSDPSLIEMDVEKVKAWIAKGAQPSETVSKLLAIAENPDAQAPGVDDKRVSKKARQKAAKPEAAAPAPAAEEPPADEAVAAGEPVSEEEAAAEGSAPEEEPVPEEPPAEEGPAVEPPAEEGPAVEESSSAEDLPPEAAETE